MEKQLVKQEGKLSVTRLVIQREQQLEIQSLIQPVIVQAEVRLFLMGILLRIQMVQAQTTGSPIVITRDTILEYLTEQVILTQCPKHIAKQMEQQIVKAVVIHGETMIQEVTLKTVQLQQVLPLTEASALGLLELVQP